jgi:hypothetical protein
MAARKSVDKGMSNMNHDLDRNIQYLQQMSKMLKSQNRCLEMGGRYTNECSNAIANKYLRELPFMKNLIYPWKNYDWDYSGYVEKYYEPKANYGASDNSSLTTIVRNVNAIINLIDGLLTDPNPSGDKQSIGEPNPKIVPSAASDPNAVRNDLVPCGSNKFDPQKVDSLKRNVTSLMGQIETLQGKPKDSSNRAQLSLLQASLNGTIALLDQFGGACSLLNQTKIDGLRQRAPYNDSFFQKYPLTGLNSSSFYAQVGFCPTNITTQAECDQKGYQWTPNPLAEVIPSSIGSIPAGTCMRGKYAYIDNKPGLSIGQIKNFKGLIPSLVNDMLDLSPDKIFAVASGQGVPGFAVQHCDEGFRVGKHRPGDSRCSAKWILLTLIVISIVVSLTIWMSQH